MLSRSEVKRVAAEVGFDDCGIAPADALNDDDYPLRRWLTKGWQAGLSYMERNVEKRMDPRKLVADARSIICVVSRYAPPSPEQRGGVAAYAQQRDYHEEVRNGLFLMRERLGIEAKVCCDTVPISDKHWAARAGLGWIGRHTLLVTPRWGSWVNLGELVTTEECDAYDSPSPTPTTCHNCHRCVDACPNQALDHAMPPMLNASRCTAYYTTHHPQPMPPELDNGGYTLGCDLCQLACPHNIKAMKNQQ